MLSRICIALIAVSAIASASADTVVLYNVQGVTPVGQKGLQQFNAIVIEDGRIKRIGVLDGTAHKVPATIVDGGGKYVLPGLTDAHGHVLGLGEPTCATRRASTTRSAASANTWPQIPRRAG